MPYHIGYMRGLQARLIRHIGVDYMMPYAAAMTVLAAMSLGAGKTGRGKVSIPTNHRKGREDGKGKRFYCRF